MLHSPKISPKTRFCLKLLLLALPLFPIVAIYFIFDHYMGLHSYKRFDNSPVLLNEAHVGWQNYLQNRDSIAYNSFILGNSCTMAFLTGEWEKYLDKDDHAVRFYDNWESLGGVRQKLQALDSVGAPLKNVLVVLDKKALDRSKPLSGNDHLFSAEAAGISQLGFHLRFLQEFLYPDKTIPYIGYLIGHKYAPYMKGVINPGDPIREPYTNNFINPREKEIGQDGELYWTHHEKEFKKRTDAGKEELPAVSVSQIQVLRAIKKICDKHHTNLKFIIGPDYFQKKTNREDIKRMKEILGASAVWDFTGTNEYTADIHHYYDPGHYRPLLGARLLKVIYQDSAPAGYENNPIATSNNTKTSFTPNR